MSKLAYIGTCRKFLKAGQKEKGLLYSNLMTNFCEFRKIQKSLLNLKLRISTVFTYFKVETN